MKNIYAFFAAALMSVSMFASLEQVPTVADLSKIYDGTTNVVLCCYFDETPCNDVVLAGSYNGWSDDPALCAKFEALEGFEGWYVAEAPYAEGFMAKPLQLKNGGFDGWAYQVGDPDAWENKGGEGTKAIKLSVENDVESKAEYPEGAGYYVYEIKYWKNHASPCEYIPSHKYTVYLFAPECEYVQPAIVGVFDGWAGTAMSKTTYEGDEAYTYEVTSEEGKEFKFFDLVLKWDNEIQFHDTVNDSWDKGSNIKFPVATQDTILVFDYSDPDMARWTVCTAPEEASDVVVIAKLPAGAPAAGVELMGSWGEDTWNNGVVMELDATTGAYIAAVQAKSTHAFKFRETGNWDNQIQQWIPANEENPEGKWEVLGNIKFGDVWKDGEGDLLGKKVVDIDFTDPAEYCWQVAEGIENIVLTEKAQKVVVDGVLYIVRDNKMFNVQGAQVR